MQTWHIHIDGLVQGVGFRPTVCRMAEQFQVHGWVSNSTDGVHIVFCGDNEKAEAFYNHIINNPPPNAIIRSHVLHETIGQDFKNFTIHDSDRGSKPNLLITPDIALCPSCRREMTDDLNRRYQYAFTTCLECGPRYSIIQAIPYDRENTTMSHLGMCDTCQEEYNNIYNRRHYSQTNSCPDCTIPMHLYNHEGHEIGTDPAFIMIMVQESLEKGHTVAVKGMGGYLLLADATNQVAVKSLRDKKQRPGKPFAVMYPDLEMAAKDVILSEPELMALNSRTAPVVLCMRKENPGSGLCHTMVAPGLDKIGVLIPYTPLLQLIAEKYNKPLVATSGNLSGSPIIYADDEALLWLTEQADLILSFDRDIVAPQDDSVMQIAPESLTPVIIRRSRGLAPNYYPSPFNNTTPVLAMGAELKSAFAILEGQNLYISQYLGDQQQYDAQAGFTATLQHMMNLLDFAPKEILVDKHPNYFVSEAGIELAAEWNIPLVKVQHHEAHFCAVMGENNLLRSAEPVLGITWDGTGFGDDGHIWGGECFLYEQGEIRRYAHLDYFPQLMGDKMSREPRVSAIALLREDMEKLKTIGDQFMKAEREFYLKVLAQPQNLLTSSMGRFIDGIAAILGIISINSYEGEAAMKLEAAARSCKEENFDYYPVPVNQNRLEWNRMIHELLEDKKQGMETAAIARKVLVSLARIPGQLAKKAGVQKIAFSGGVFQNVFLIDLICTLWQNEFELYFHRQLSPNDECIGFGQLAYREMTLLQNELNSQRSSAVSA